ncbi:hypothetical protein [Streptomyces sp. YIM 121038]|uniref:hypothetical protein n=1 Tax=Streptomyces sp. YIM 121038 TaxID=2136401 RepID=UPI0011104A03|nr:hypothetical protein [Streptomyces sp. YIM 121038]
MDAPTRTARCFAGDAWLAAEASLTVALNTRRIPVWHRGPLLADAIVMCAQGPIPAGAGHLADVRPPAVRPPGRILQTPSTSTSYPTGGSSWLELPDGTGRLTQGDRPGAALGSGGPSLPTEALG